MTEESKNKSIAPHIILAAVVGIIIVAAYFMFSGDEQADLNAPPIAIESKPVEPAFSPESTADSSDYVTEDDALANDEPVALDMPEPMPEPEPLDTSDAAVKTSLLSIANYETAARLLVNDDLLRRFVVLTSNAANKTLVPKHQVVVAPEQAFRVYEQSDKTFIDASSFKRYTPYVDAIDSMDTPALLSLYETYKPALDNFYAEIGDPDDDFKFVLVDAINHILDTPEVPMPMEVYTESVMYKFKDQRLEELSSVQKQLLRTGPENMRRLKSKLREIKDALQE
ncbi:DUF3014 domain-containing protein [Aliiglaciecola sp. LCG003]|uniref:DUF3014 domain-containing protein n=1 Tax=Aliiglaciecola sp. LCG003 TaxID=3053655 RepID=UPI0025727F4C|nr:DUF3014 domain-containing protein [Aliiglaciecola sp. LCG003]WJG09379.1 DUF3014 domain-containing protein [Aliiglaciecola sp. LCG003]